MSELDTVKDGAVFLAVGGFAVKLWWDDREKKRAALEVEAATTEKKTQSRSEVLIEKVSDALVRIEGDLRDLRNVTSNQAGAVAAVKERIDHVSANHGERITELELWRAGVEAKRRR